MPRNPSSPFSLSHKP